MTTETMDTEDLRLMVYRTFRDTGRAPTTAELATSMDLPVDRVRQGLRHLARQRHLVLNGDHIVMAHPFSAIPMGFSVMGRNTLWWGGCCWDSFALAHLLPDEPDVLVATRCPGCATPHAWVVDRDAPPQGDWRAHFLVPAARMWDDVVYTCRNQRLFCSEACIDGWVTRESLERGATMDLETLWHLARNWYDGRLERGYQRREPGDAVAYLRSVGLTGPFWGTS